jgi:hypothetical protein
MFTPHEILLMTALVIGVGYWRPKRKMARLHSKED